MAAAPISFPALSIPPAKTPSSVFEAGAIKSSKSEAALGRKPDLVAPALPVSAANKQGDVAEEAEEVERGKKEEEEGFKTPMRGAEAGGERGGGW